MVWTAHGLMLVCSMPKHYYQLSVIHYVRIEEHCLGLFLGLIKALVVKTECKTKTAKNYFLEIKLKKDDTEGQSISQDCKNKQFLSQ